MGAAVKSKYSIEDAPATPAQSNYTIGDDTSAPASTPKAPALNTRLSDSLDSALPDVKPQDINYDNPIIPKSIDATLQTSGRRLVRGVGDAVLHPFDTIKGIGKSVLGAADELGSVAPDAPMSKPSGDFGTPISDTLSSAYHHPGQTASDLGVGLLAGEAGGALMKGVPEIGSGIRSAAIGDADASALRGLRVPASGKKVLPMQSSVETARPYFQGADSLEDFQSKVPDAKNEVWKQYKDVIDNEGHRQVRGPDGMTTLRDLEDERSQLSALNRGIKSGDPSSLQLAEQKGMSAADLLERERAVKKFLDPEIQRYGVDPLATRKTFGAVARLGNQVEGRSTLLEKPQPYGFGKIANLSFEKPFQAPGKIISGVRDMVAGRPMLSGSPTDIGIREGFRGEFEKPNLGSYKPIQSAGALEAPPIEIGRATESGGTPEGYRPPPFYADTTPMRIGKLLDAPPIELGGRVAETPQPMFRHDTTPMRMGRTLPAGVSDDFPLSSYKDIFPNQLPEGTRIRPKIIEGKK